MGLANFSICQRWVSIFTLYWFGRQQSKVHGVLHVKTLKHKASLKLRRKESFQRNRALQCLAYLLEKCAKITKKIGLESTESAVGFWQFLFVRQIHSSARLWIQVTNSSKHCFKILNFRILLKWIANWSGPIYLFIALLFSW